MSLLSLFVAIWVAGRTGLEIQISWGHVFVNGHRIEEPYLADGTVTGPGAMRSRAYLVAPDCYFVLGDNRAESADSRYFGAVPREWIAGRISSVDAIMGL